VKDIVTHHDWLATVLDRFGLDAKDLHFDVGTQKLSLVENPNARVIQEILA
jgi:arylsulfatase A-like enzyme